VIETAGVYIGPAGWSYPDWNGIVYPQNRPPGFDELAWIAGMFNLVEVNSSFYRVPSPKTVESWVRRVAARSDFLFSVKAFRGFTHERDATERDARSFRAALEPLAAAGRLAAVLFQFEWRFEDRPEHRDLLRGLADRFRDLPRAVEVRHASWNHEDALDFFRADGWSFCNVDQPRSQASITGTAYVTAATAYVRLHGRNREAWFRKDAGRDERYNYYYSRRELEYWVRAAHAMAAEAERILIVANNHFRGQAVANALQLAAMLTGTVPEVPASLAQAYPDLAPRVDAGGPSEAEGTCNPCDS
jgi:uncharacterized protein YecE (DUF72 family)